MLQEQDERISKVREQLDQGYPETWRFDEDGAEVIGYARRTSTGNTVNGPVPILILEVDGVERSVWCMHTALLNRLRESNIQPGDVVGIRQLGEVEPKGGGRPYVAYNVVVHGTGGNELSFAAPAELEAAAPVEDAEVYYADEAPHESYSDTNRVSGAGTQRGW